MVDGEIKIGPELYCNGCDAQSRRTCENGENCKPNPLFKCPEHEFDNSQGMAGLGALFGGPVCVICGIDKEWIESEEVNQRRSARRKNHPCYGCKHLKGATIGSVEGPNVSLPVCYLTTSYGKTTLGNGTVACDLAHTKCDDYEEKAPDITLQDACDSGKCNAAWVEHAPNCEYAKQLREEEVPQPDKGTIKEFEEGTGEKVIRKDVLSMMQSGELWEEE